MGEIRDNSHDRRSDLRAADPLLALVYDELHEFASAQLSNERPGQTLDTSALVHEAYLRIVSKGAGIHFANQRHFFTVAARAMRRVLIDAARRKNRVKHGGGRKRLPLSDNLAYPADEVVDLDEALEELAEEDELAASVVELKFFVGMTISEIAGTLGVSEYVVHRKWTYAKARMQRAMAE